MQDRLHIELRSRGEDSLVVALPAARKYRNISVLVDAPEQRISGR
jgi:hypothetical protein